MAGTMLPVNPDLALALELADVADELTMRRYRADDLVVETKPDLTPVTEADRAVEDALRARLARQRAGHAVLGEEFGAEGDGPWRWIIDPIDGTKNYVRGVPVWATLIALQHDGVGVLGVASAPALARRWWAVRGDGAYAGGSRLRVSKVSRVEDAHIAYDSIPDLDSFGVSDRFVALARRCWRTRGFGDFWSHLLVAEGAVDVAVEVGVNLWDMAAVQVIVEEAGGRFTDLAGTARADGGSGVSTNGLLHDEVLAALSVA
jgi:histidinol-phosphatase